MSIEKRQLLIDVEAGKVVCGECEWLKDGECVMFERSLTDDAVRCPECLAAEKRATDITLNAAIAKAQVPAEAR
jgi:hypothetical protein